MAKTYYKGACGVIIVYDITNMDSFRNVPTWLREVSENTTEDQVAKLIIGNKKDLVEEV